MPKKKKRDGQEFFPLKKGKGLEKVLTIDPGMWRTRLAFWPTLANDKAVWHPEKTCLLQTDKNDHWVKKSDGIISQLWQFFVTLGRYNIDLAIIEMPGLWMDSEVSMAAAAKGDLFKLAVLIGRIEEAIKDYEADTGVIVTHVSPQMWKGQLPKRLVKKRISWALHKEYPDDVEDAVGIGLSIQDKL